MTDNQNMNKLTDFWSMKDVQQQQPSPQAFSLDPLSVRSLGKDLTVTSQLTVESRRIEHKDWPRRERLGTRLQKQHFLFKTASTEWLKCFRNPWFLCFCLFVCMFSFLLAFKIDERASKQDCRQFLSLLFTSNYYAWVFSDDERRWAWFSINLSLSICIQKVNFSLSIFKLINVRPMTSSHCNNYSGSPWMQLLKASTCSWWQLYFILWRQGRTRSLKLWNAKRFFL